MFHNGDRALTRRTKVVVIAYHFKDALVLRINRGMETDNSLDHDISFFLVVGGYDKWKKNINELKRINSLNRNFEMIS